MRYWGQRMIALAIMAAGLALLTSPVASAHASHPSHARVEQLGLAPRRQTLPLVFPLRANVAGLERLATAVSTVGSPEYGHYVPIPVLARRFGASLGDRLRVTRFLHGNGATHVRIDATGLFADATLSVGRARQLFGASLSRFHATRAGSYVAPTSGAHVPAALKGAVTGVVGLDTQPVVVQPAVKIASGAGFPRTQARFSADNTPSGYQHRTGTAAGCADGQGDRGFTPNQYLDAYGYSPLHAAGIKGQGERVSLIEIDGFRYSDLRTFAGCFGLSIPAVNGFGVNIKHPLTPIGETELDLQVIDAAAPGLKGIDVYESRARPSDVLQSLTAPLQNRGRVPDVISVSLGVCEPALDLAVGRSGLRAVEGALALETASGISVLASSGDDGSSSCIVGGDPLPVKATSFPASSPFVTGVGGTNFVLGGSNQIQGETVWNDAPYDLSAGGGGTSALFARPSYQNGFTAQRNRDVPDVSMLADLLPGYNIFCSVKACQGYGSGWVAVGGTSASSPLFAGGLALIDQMLRRARQAEPRVGQLAALQGAAPLRLAERLLRYPLGQQRSGPVHPGRQPAPAGLLHGRPGLRPRLRSRQSQPQPARFPGPRATAPDRRRGHLAAAAAPDPPPPSDRAYQLLATLHRRRQRHDRHRGGEVDARGLRPGGPTRTRPAHGDVAPFPRAAAAVALGARPAPGDLCPRRRPGPRPRGQRRGREPHARHPHPALAGSSSRGLAPRRPGRVWWPPRAP